MNYKKRQPSLRRHNSLSEHAFLEYLVATQSSLQGGAHFTPIVFSLRMLTCRRWKFLLPSNHRLRIGPDPLVDDWKGDEDAAL